LSYYQNEFQSNPRRNTGSRPTDLFSVGRQSREERRIGQYHLTNGGRSISSVSSLQTRVIYTYLYI
jgi:hypothetical protein